MIAEGLALIDKAMRHRNSGPYQVQAAIAALHARAEKPRIPTGSRSICSTLRRARDHAAVAGRDAQPGGCGIQGARGRRRRST